MLVEHHPEVLLTASDDVGIFQVLQDIRIQLHHLVLMGGAEIHVVVKDGPVVAGIFQESLHLLTNHRIDGIVGAEHHNVVRLYLRKNEVQAVVGMILIEDVLRVVLLVEKRQRYG